MGVRARANVISSFTIAKGALIEETYTTFQHWDPGSGVDENLHRLRAGEFITASSASWLKYVAKVIHRRFDPQGCDRVLVELARNGYDSERWKPLLLWHMTRDEFLLRDFLINWLYPRYTEGTYRIRVEDVVPFIEHVLAQRNDSTWSAVTTERVASGLLKIAVDFGLMKGRQAREFASYHLPEESFLYILHAMAEREPNPQRIVHSPDWRLYLLAPDDVERELLRLHQFRKIDYQVAGSIVQLKLPYTSAAEYARELGR